jgi:uncharacterized protein YciI
MSDHQPPSVEFELDTFELVLLRQGARAAELDEDTRTALQSDHLHYLFGLQAAGKLQAAGAFMNHQSLTGLGFYRTGSIDEVRRLTEEDPAVKAGLDAYEIVVLVCPKGAITFPFAGQR